MFCAYCGTANADGARFCKSCGKPLRVIEETLVTDTYAEPRVESVKTEPSVNEPEITEESLELQRKLSQMATATMPLHTEDIKIKEYQVLESSEDINEGLTEAPVKYVQKEDPRKNLTSDFDMFRGPKKKRPKIFTPKALKTFLIDAAVVVACFIYIRFRG